jgi:4-hydroxybenzoate polyprenyltransferase
VVTRRMLSVLKIGSVRFSAYYFPAFVVALDSGGMATPAWVALALALCVTNCLGIELTNRWADRVEDEVNQPERTALCRSVGYDRIRQICVSLYALLLVGYICWYAVAHNAELLAVQLMSWLVGWNYSVGLRCKRFRWGVLFTLTSTFALPFAFGWAIHSSLATMPMSVLVIPVFVISLAGLKDITDTAGDRLRGYKSLFLELASRSRLLPLLVSPYAVATLLVIVEASPARLLLIWLFAPLSLAFQRLVARAASRAEKSAVREMMYNFWLAFVLATLFLTRPTASVVVWSALSIFLWWGASRWLHWHSLSAVSAFQRGLRLAGAEPLSRH